MTNNSTRGHPSRADLVVLEPGAEPAVGDFVVVALRVRAEVDLADLAAPLVAGVGPGADDEPGVLAGRAGGGVVGHAGEVLDRADLLVVPAGRHERGDLDPGVLRLEAEVVGGVVAQPLAPVRADAGQGVVGYVHERQMATAT